MREPLAVYERTVAASIERVWENVLDWEHLPHLHRTSFTAIRHLGGNRDGWRAVIGLPVREGPGDATIEVELDRARLRYVTRTTAGLGEGTEITTRLEPRLAEITISVEFAVPGVPPERRTAVGSAYTSLYRRLWDEDEGMMIRREAVLRGERGLALRRCEEGESWVPLGAAGTLRTDERLVEARERRWRIVPVDGELVVHSAVCPHLGGPLEEAPVEEGCVTCPWHGYRYDVRTGRGRDGIALRLDAPPRLEIDPRTDEAFLVFDAPERSR